MTELRFRAMGSDCHVIVVGGPAGLAEQAKERIDELECRWSRFRPDSEISRLNERAGRPIAVSDETVELLQRAMDAWRLSGGSFDPTLLGAVIRAGYDRTFEEIGPGSGRSLLHAGADRIVIEGNVVTIPEGVGFDPGGIGKGLAADMVAVATTRAGADGVAINMGGDVRTTGTGPDGGTWTVSIEHPWLDAPLARVGLAGGAIATSTTLRRNWVADGVRRHHLIDPQTGQPSDTDINLASVVAAETWAAEVLAKAVVLRGSAHPFDNLGGTGAQGLAVTDDGRVLSTEGFGAYLGDGRLPGWISS